MNNKIIENLNALIGESKEDLKNTLQKANKSRVEKDLESEVYWLRESASIFRAISVYMDKLASLKEEDINDSV